MIRSRSYLIFLLMFSSVGLSAQTFNAYKGKHELSLNAQGIASNFGPFGLWFGEASDFTQPLLRYRFHMNDHAIRVGATGSHYENDAFSSDSTFSNGLTQRLDVFVGYQYTFTEFGRLHAYVGVDGMWGKVKNNSEGSWQTERESRYESETTTSGARPFIGVYFFITPRISISTEMAMVASQTQTISSSFRSWNEPQQVDSDSQNFSITYTYPRVLYLDFRF